MWPTPSDVHDLADEEHFTAEHALHYFLEAQGVEVADVGVSDVVVGTFLRYTWKPLVEATGGEPAKYWLRSQDSLPLHHGSVGGRPVTLVQFPVGAAGAVLQMEMLIACGARHFLILGAAGSLQEQAPIGSLVVPDAAVREEGTSFHYLPPETVAKPGAGLAELVRNGCRERGIEPVTGSGWSTDAIFRELKKKVQYYRSQGVVCVDMEASAMFAVGMFRQVEVAFLLGISDELFRPWAPAFLHDTYRERLLIGQEVLLEVAGKIPAP
jgi:uridine phosphorylase